MRTETIHSLKTETKITVKTFLLNAVKARIVSCETKRNEIISHINVNSGVCKKRPTDHAHAYAGIIPGVQDVQGSSWSAVPTALPGFQFLLFTLLRLSFKTVACCVLGT